MNHMNFFNPFKNHDEWHEDVLTRNFLLLVKNIPLVQIAFLEEIRKAVNGDVDIPSAVYQQLKLTDIRTQVVHHDSMMQNLEGTNIVSVLMSDDKLETMYKATNSDRSARYDGVIVCDPNWLFTVENKPNKNNVWLEQLNPNIKDDESNVIHETPACLSWRDMISLLSMLLDSAMLLPIERTLIEDFLAYIDEHYSWLNPYHKFALCKSDEYLINRKCMDVLAKCYPEKDVKYLKGWKHYIESGKSTIKFIALDTTAPKNTTDSWTVDLWMYAGDTMLSAREVYQKLNLNKLWVLSESDRNFTITPNFHFSFMSKGLLWLTGNKNATEYIRFWQTQGEIHQLKRSEFVPYFEMLAQNGIVCYDTDFPRFEEKILAKDYTTLNVCPGFLIKYTWDKESVLRLEKQGDDVFVENCKRIIESVFDVFD